MFLHASWVHGNVVTVESPENSPESVTMAGAATSSFVPGKSSWLHIPLPTPVIVGDVRTTVQRPFCDFHGRRVRDSVHVYDGSSKVQEVDNLNNTGEHRTGLGGAKTFDLAQPHSVLWGMGLTSFVTADIGFDTQTSPRLIVSSAGGDFRV